MPSTLTLKQYGIVLKRLSEETIELVRYWRNRPEIRKYMGYRQQITEEMQKAWFKTVNNKYNYYFVINYNNEDIGIINVKNVHPVEKYAEGGIFIWKQELLNSFVPSLATLIVLDFSLCQLQLNNKSYIHILKTNTRAIAYNKLIGYSLVPYQDRVRNQLYILTYQDFMKSVEKLRTGARALTQTNGVFEMTGKISDTNLPEINNYLKKHSSNL